MAITMLLFTTFANSCVRYIDKVSAPRRIQIMQGDLTFYRDSNILIYKSVIGIKKDTEVGHSKPFYAKLPKRLKWYEISNSESFNFFYDNDQAIVVNIDLFESSSLIDTTYVPDKDEIVKFIASCPIATSDNYDLKNISVKTTRKQLLIKKNSASILLFNIEPGNINLFESYLLKFKFL